jgi:hypothetical protein
MGFAPGDMIAGTAQMPPRHRTRIVTGRRATLESLGWIAMEVGIFERLGLDCTFPRLETGGPEAVAGIVRGDWEFAETGSAPYVQASLDGNATTILLAAVEPLPTGLPIDTPRHIRPEPAGRKASWRADGHGSGRHFRAQRPAGVGCQRHPCSTGDVRGNLRCARVQRDRRRGSGQPVGADGAVPEPGRPHDSGCSAASTAGSSAMTSRRHARTRAMLASARSGIPPRVMCAM